MTLKYHIQCRNPCNTPVYYIASDHKKEQLPNPAKQKSKVRISQNIWPEFQRDALLMN
jgi:hypothetical protein